jgi:S1-C subfamily serine protease
VNLVDWVLVGAIVVFAWTGWRQGFVAGLLSFAGFLGGGVLGALIVPSVIERTSLVGVLRALVVAVGVLSAAALGQVLAGTLGRRLRDGITWRPARLVDNLGGAALNVLALAVVLWIVASAVAVLPGTALTRQIRQSSVLVGLDRLVPDGARDLFTGLRDLVDSSGMPRVFSGLGELAGPEVDAPDPALAKDPAVRAAWDSLVQVLGDAPECGTSVTGSGFVYAPERVLTNAHVVAGVDQPQVQLRGTGQAYPARVVAFDPSLDLAVLLVPGLPATSLDFADRPAGRGDPAVVAGFPGGGRLTATAARIRAVLPARGEDIYGRSGVLREVYAFRGEVRPGNSGGPLLAPTGDVYGVVFASGVGDQTTGYAITAEQAEEVAAAGADAVTRVGTGSCRTRR